MLLQNWLPCPSEKTKGEPDLSVQVCTSPHHTSVLKGVLDVFTSNASIEVSAPLGQDYAFFRDEKFSTSYILVRTQRRYSFKSSTSRKRTYNH